MTTLSHKLRDSVSSAFVCLCLILFGCTEEATLADDFHIPAGSSRIFNTDLRVVASYSGLYFTLSEISAKKNDRDFSDFLSIELIDDKGESFRPDKIWDINGQRRDVVASFNNIPVGTRIEQIHIGALQELKGKEIRWWSGNLN